MSPVCHLARASWVRLGSPGVCLSHARSSSPSSGTHQPETSSPSCNPTVGPHPGTRPHISHQSGGDSWLNEILQTVPAHSDIAAKGYVSPPSCFKRFPLIGIIISPPKCGIYTSFIWWAADTEGRVSTDELSIIMSKRSSGGCSPVRQISHLSSLN